MRWEGMTCSDNQAGKRSDNGGMLCGATWGAGLGDGLTLEHTDGDFRLTCVVVHITRNGQKNLFVSLGPSSTEQTSMCFRTRHTDSFIPGWLDLCRHVMMKGVLNNSGATKLRGQHVAILVYGEWKMKDTTAFTHPFSQSFFKSPHCGRNKGIFCCTLCIESKHTSRSTGDS